MDVVSMSLRLVGGGSFPGKVGTVSATWPMVILTANDAVIEMDVRPRLLRRIVGRRVRGAEEAALWSIAWEQLESAEIGRRSMILRLASGQRGCRFVTMTRRQLKPLIAELERRNVPVKHRTSTLGWFMRR